MAWTTAIGVAEVLVGRASELVLVGAFVERARTGGEALLLCGEPGAGKTALLDAAAEAAVQAGSLVLRAAGVEFEADLTYSALHQVLLPVFGEFGRLSAVHQDALNAALGLSETPPPGRLRVSAAALTVLPGATGDHCGERLAALVESFRVATAPDLQEAPTIAQSTR